MLMSSLATSKNKDFNNYQLIYSTNNYLLPPMFDSESIVVAPSYQDLQIKEGNGKKWLWKSPFSVYIFHLLSTHAH